MTRFFTGVATLACLVASARAAHAESDVAVEIGGAAVYEGNGAREATGAAARVRLYLASPWHGRAPADRMEPFIQVIAAIGTAGIVFVPTQVWLGNERGVALAVRGFADEAAIGIAPVLRVHTGHSPLRVPSVVGVFAPEVGARVGSEGVRAIYLEVARFPVSFDVARGWSVELGPSLQVDFPVGGGEENASARVMLELGAVRR